MGRNLLVVGASSDMGFAAIKKIWRNYDLVIAHYRSMNEQLSALREELGDRLLPIQADLADEEDLRSLIAQIRERAVEPTHILHFPAPLCQNKHFHKIKWEVFQRELDISLKSFVVISQAFLPFMAKQKRGKIVAMLSFVVNNMPPKHCANYVITKYAMLGAVKAMAVEYADKGITVNGVSPAWVMTKYLNNQPDFLVEQNAAESPLGRNLETDDVTPAIEYLLSGGADCVNGQNLTVSFGR